jgi:hypothetical protein
MCFRCEWKPEWKVFTKKRTKQNLLFRMVIVVTSATLLWRNHDIKWSKCWRNNDYQNEKIARKTRKKYFQERQYIYIPEPCKVMTHEFQLIPMADSHFISSFMYEKEETTESKRSDLLYHDKCHELWN